MERLKLAFINYQEECEIGNLEVANEESEIAAANIHNLTKKHNGGAI